MPGPTTPHRLADRESDLHSATPRSHRARRAQRPVRPRPRPYREAQADGPRPQPTGRSVPRVRDQEPPSRANVGHSSMRSAH